MRTIAMCWVLIDAVVLLRALVRWYREPDRAWENYDPHDVIEGVTRYRSVR